MWLARRLRNYARKITTFGTLYVTDAISFYGTDYYTVYGTERGTENSTTWWTVGQYNSYYNTVYDVEVQTSRETSAPVAYITTWASPYYTEAYQLQEYLTYYNTDIFSQRLTDYIVNVWTNGSVTFQTSAWTTPVTYYLTDDYVYNPDLGYNVWTTFWTPYDGPQYQTFFDTSVPTSWLTPLQVWGYTEVLVGSVQTSALTEGLVPYQRLTEAQLSRQTSYESTYYTWFPTIVSTYHQTFGVVSGGNWTSETYYYNTTDMTSHLTNRTTSTPTQVGTDYQTWRETSW